MLNISTIPGKKSWLRPYVIAPVLLGPRLSMGMRMLTVIACPGSSKPAVKSSGVCNNDYNLIPKNSFISVSPTPWSVSREDLPENHISDRYSDAVITAAGVLTVLRKTAHHVHHTDTVCTYLSVSYAADLA